MSKHYATSCYDNMESRKRQREQIVKRCASLGKKTGKGGGEDFFNHCSLIFMSSLIVMCSNFVRKRRVDSSQALGLGRRYMAGDWLRSAGNLDRSLSEPEMGKEIMKFCEKKNHQSIKQRLSFCLWWTHLGLQIIPSYLKKIIAKHTHLNITRCSHFHFRSHAALARQAGHSSRSFSEQSV